MGHENLILNAMYGTDRRLSSGGDDDGTNDTAKITFQIIFYSLFVGMLVGFWFVFKKSGAK